MLPNRRHIRPALLGLLLFLFLPAVHAATFNVTTTTDDPNDAGSLRAAVNGVQASADPSDTITFSVTGTITLTHGELALSNPNTIAGKTVTINGPGAAYLTVSGNNATRVLHVSGLTANVSGVILTQGRSATAGGAALAEGAGTTLRMSKCSVTNSLSTGGNGGGLANTGGAVILTNCVFTGNGGNNGGDIASAGGSLTMTRCTVQTGNLNTSVATAGGGLYSTNDTVVLTDCTFTGNVADPVTGSGGGAVYSAGDRLTMTGCTLAYNSGHVGGGLDVAAGTQATLIACTLTGNGTIADFYRTASDGGGIANAGALTLTDCTVSGNSVDTSVAGVSSGGGGLYNTGTALVTSTILAGNSGGGNAVNAGGTVTSGGSNLVGDPDGNGFTNDPNHADPNSANNHDQTNVANPGLGSLADNGGPTQTLALTAGSPAIDGDFADAMTTDQRGATRPVGPRGDIGAFEFGATAPSAADTYIVTNANDAGAGSLRDAIANVNADPGAHILFDPTVFGPGRPQTITLTSGPLGIGQAVTLAGPGAALLTVSGNHASRVFVLGAVSGTINLSGMTIADGDAGTDLNNYANYQDGGGGILAGGGVNITDCVITGCTAALGGGTLLLAGEINLTRCVISGNTATNGGGAYTSDIAGFVGFHNCTISDNTALGDGGGIYCSNLTLLQDSTISNNTAQGNGGGVYSIAYASIITCTISGNTAAAGGGVYTYYEALLFTCTVSANAAGTGGGLYNAGAASTNVTATILAGNLSGGNVVNAGGTVTSGGSNLIGDPDGNGFTNDPNHADPNSAGNHDQTGVTNPLLGPLADNGGLTQTQALLPGSPAIDANFFGSVQTTDQRGVPVPIGARADIGAYEYGGIASGDDTYAVRENTTLTVPAPGVLANDTGDGSPLTAVVQTQPAHGTLQNFGGDGSFTYTPNTGFQGTDTFTYQAQSAGGQGGTAAVTLTVAAALPPTTAATVSGPLGNSGFYRGTATVTLTATDNSGDDPITTFFAVNGGAQQAYTAPISLSADGVYALTFFSRDAAGRTEPSQSLTVKVDATPPTLTFGTPTPAANASGYTNTPVSVPYTAADATAGVASASPGSPVTFTAEGAHQTRTVTVTDNAGNSAAFTTPPVSIDLTPPVTTAAGQSTATGETVTLSATDALSGVAATTYAVDGGSQMPYAGPIAVGGNGPHTVTYASTDNAGNAEATKTLTFTVNTTAPVTTATLSGPQGQSGYYTGPVTVTLAAASQASTVTGTFYAVDGGAQRTYTGPFTVSGDARHIITYFSTDAAGDTEAANQKPIPIDGTPPATTASVAGTKNSAGAYVGAATVTLMATDALSGVAATVYTLDGGASTPYTGAFTVSTPDAHTVTFHSTDKAGNAETAQTVSLTVAAPPTGSSVLHIFPAGLQMFAVTESYAAGTALSPVPSRLAVWDPAIVQYTLSEGDSALVAGQGYWARFAQATALSDAGTPTPTGQPFAITLKKGWNMIGDPFPAPVSLTTVRVQDASGKGYSLSDASKAGLVAYTVYGFPAGSARYQAQDGSGTLSPYEGYWLYAFRDCTLEVSAP